MSTPPPSRQPCWVESDQALPDPAQYAVVAPADPTSEKSLWPDGLIAAGADLSAARLLEAYCKGLFPWYSAGEPVLWWSPDPRMVLKTEQFRLRRSLIKTLRQWQRAGCYRITMNRNFERVMAECAAPRPDQNGTWITADVRSAYQVLHHRQYAHSIEVWRTDQKAAPALIGGLYGVSIGRMFFGESMFARERDASKIALASLVTLLRTIDMPMIDCQQKTGHLSSLGAREIPRVEFLAHIAALLVQKPPDWSAISIEFPAV